MKIWKNISKAFKVMHKESKAEVEERICSVALLKIFRESLETSSNGMSTINDYKASMLFIMRESARAMHENHWIEAQDLDAIESDNPPTDRHGNR